MQQKQTRDFLIRNMPVELYHSFEEAAKAHHRSRTQEAIVALTKWIGEISDAAQKTNALFMGQKDNKPLNTRGN